MSRVAHDSPPSTLSFSSASSLRSFISGSSQSTLRGSSARTSRRIARIEDAGEEMQSREQLYSEI